ncbi:MAG: ABC transporter ATP-binding protein [Thermoplasmata archaeon]|nr:ABC transporter ATP-binding protein [Thermoplasmata archaeon]
MIEAKDLRFSYQDGKEILKGVSFRSEENTVISILGPNGTGKTTFLKCLCGIQRPTSGSIEVDGAEISSYRGKELSRKIAFVPQSVPPSRMSVFDAVLIGRRPHIEFSMSDSDLDKVSEIINAMGMADISLKYLDEISGGEFQKTQIARAIVQEPSVLILDEPSNNLDIANQHTTMRMILDAVRSRGMCTIMTMHDINLAVHYSDKFLFLKDGAIEAYGGMEIIDRDLIRKVYGVEADVIKHRGVPFVVPAESDKYSGRRL